MSSKSMIRGYGWHSVQRFLPYDLDAYAVECGVLQRRRCVKNGDRLVRALCLCAVPKSTFEQAADVARQYKIADLSPQALFKRMVSAEPLLKGLFVYTLGHATGKAERWKGFRM